MLRHDLCCVALCDLPADILRCSVSARDHTYHIRHIPQSESSFSPLQGKKMDVLLSDAIRQVHPARSCIVYWAARAWKHNVG